MPDHNGIFDAVWIITSAACIVALILGALLVWAMAKEVIENGFYDDVYEPGPRKPNIFAVMWRYGTTLVRSLIEGVHHAVSRRLVQR